MVEDNKEHYIKTLSNFYSKFDNVETCRLSVVNLEIGELTIGYEENEKGKKVPIKKDVWLATFFYNLGDDKKTNDDHLLKNSTEKIFGTGKERYDLIQRLNMKAMMSWKLTTQQKK